MVYYRKLNTFYHRCWMLDAGCWTIDSLSVSFLAGLRLRRCDPRMWRDVIQKDFIHIDVGKADEWYEAIRSRTDWKMLCRGGFRGGLWGLETSHQKYIRETKRMMYWYKNTKMYYFLTFQFHTHTHKQHTHNIHRLIHMHTLIHTHACTHNTYTHMHTHTTHIHTSMHIHAHYNTYNYEPPCLATTAIYKRYNFMICIKFTIIIIYL